MNPAEILDEHFTKKSVVAPPQFIMLDVMLKYQKYQEFLDFLKNIAVGETVTCKLKVAIVRKNTNMRFNPPLCLWIIFIVLCNEHSFFSA